MNQTAASLIGSRRCVSTRSCGSQYQFVRSFDYEKSINIDDFRRKKKTHENVDGFKNLFTVTEIRTTVQ